MYSSVEHCSMNLWILHEFVSLCVRVALGTHQSHLQPYLRTPAGLQRIACTPTGQRHGVAPRRRGDAQQARGRRARGQAPKVDFCDVLRGHFDDGKTEQNFCSLTCGGSFSLPASMSNYARRDHVRPCPSIGYPHLTHTTPSF